MAPGRVFLGGGHISVHFYSLLRYQRILGNEFSLQHVAPSEKCWLSLVGLVPLLAEFWVSNLEGLYNENKVDSKIGLDLDCGRFYPLFYILQSCRVRALQA